MICELPAAQYDNRHVENTFLLVVITRILVLFETFQAPRENSKHLYASSLRKESDSNQVQKQLNG